MPLTLTTAYYIRRLMRQNLDRLQSVVATGAGIQADVLSDLNAVLQSLYLEPKELNAAELQLERLTAYHQELSKHVTAQRKGIADLEGQIFWILGFKCREIQQQGTILVIDDEPENLRLLTAALAEQGYDIRCATSGAMALMAVQNFTPDLILLDIRMAGLNGYEVCEKLKSSNYLQDVPILFLSACNDVSDKIKAFEIGGADYITKPFEIGEVLARVHHQLNIRNLKQRLEEQNMNLQREISRQTNASRSPADAASETDDELMQTISRGVRACLHRSHYNSQRTLIFANEAIESLTGYSANELVGQKRGWMDLIHPDDHSQVTSTVEMAIANRQPYSLTYRLLHRDGDPCEVYERGHIIFSSLGEPTYLDSLIISKPT